MATTIGCDNPGTASANLNPSGQFEICTCITTGIAGGGVLDAIKINLNVLDVDDQCRLALYDGSATTGPRDTAGATLIWDSGVFTGVEGWQTINAGGETIPDGTRLFIAFKSDYSDIRAYKTPTDEINDGWENYTTYLNGSGDDPNDVDTAFAATVATDWTSGSIGNAALCTQIVYSVGSSGLPGSPLGRKSLLRGLVG